MLPPSCDSASSPGSQKQQSGQQLPARRPRSRLAANASAGSGLTGRLLAPRRKRPSRRRPTIAIDGERRATRPRRGDRNARNSIASPECRRTILLATERSPGPPSTARSLGHERDRALALPGIADRSAMRSRRGRDRYRREAPTDATTIDGWNDDQPDSRGSRSSG